MGIKQLYNDNLRKLPNEDRVVSVMSDRIINQGPKILSHFSAHSVNRPLHENWKAIQKFINGKKLTKNVTLQILSFIPGS